MDINSLLISLLFGCLGAGYFMFGKSMGRMVPLGTGVALMVVPYFIPNAMAMLIVCLLLSVVPFVVHEG